jgi:hypothetical protein
MYNPFFDKQVVLDTQSNLKKVVINAAAPLVLAQGSYYDKFRAETGGMIDGQAVEVFKVSSDAHLEVCADELSLFGEIKIPGRNVALVARTLHCLRKATNESVQIEAPLIDVSGADGPPAKLPYGAPAGQPKRNDPSNFSGKVSRGKDGNGGVANRIEPFPDKHHVNTPGQPGQGRQKDVPFDNVMDGEEGEPGAPGGHAGSIVILASAITIDRVRSLPPGQGSTDTCLRLRANGGKGGEGDKGQAGAGGGQGGPGASYKSGLGFASQGWSKPTDGGNGGDGGNGILDGPGGSPGVGVVGGAPGKGGSLGTGPDANGQPGGPGTKGGDGVNGNPGN